MTKKACSKGSVIAAARRENLVEAFLDDLRDFERMEGRALDADADVPQPARRVFGSASRLLASMACRLRIV